MRFLFVIDNLSTGGAQRQMITLALGLRKRGHDVHLFCYMPGNLLQKPLEDAGVSIYYHRKSSRFSPDVIWALRQRMSMIKYDLVLSYLVTPNFYSILSRALARQRSRLVISERLGNLPGDISLVENMARWSYMAADHVVFNSNHQYRDFMHRYPWLERRSSIIYNGVDLDSFTPLPDKPFHDPLRILVVASVSPRKNGLCLVRALDILRREYNLKPIVDWVGECSRSGDRLAYLRQMELEINQLDLLLQWNWLGQRTDVVEQYHNHDVLVHPSYGEGLPNVVCEALACGCPVVLSNTLDHPYLIQHKESGYLFNQFDPNDLAMQLAEFNSLSNVVRCEMGKKSRMFAEQNLSVDLLIDRYESLFKSLIER